MNLYDIILIGLFLIIWFVLTRVIFPKFGINS